MFTAASKLQGINRQSAAAQDPFFSNVVLLMHMNGPEGGTSFPDVKGNAVTRVGDPITSTGWAGAMDGSSALFRRTPDYLVIPATPNFQFTGDVTIEFSFYLIAGGLTEIIGNYPTGNGNATTWMFRIEGSTSPRWYVTSGVITSILAGGIGTLLLNTKYAIALVRAGNTCNVYVNGVLNGTVQYASTNAIGSPSTLLGIGAGPNGREPANCYIDEVRITKNVARYTSNYTPSTVPFPDS